MRLLFGHDRAVADFVAERDPVGTPDFTDCVAIGVLDASGCLIAGAVYSAWKPRYGTLEFSGAAVSPLAFSPGTVRAILSFPFLRLSAQKLWAQTSIRNLRAQKLLKGVGFTPEAVLKSELGPNHHARRYRLLRSEWAERYGEIRLAA